MWGVASLLVRQVLFFECGETPTEARRERPLPPSPTHFLVLSVNQQLLNGQKSLDTRIFHPISHLENSALQPHRHTIHAAQRSSPLMMRSFHLAISFVKLSMNPTLASDAAGATELKEYRIQFITPFA